MELKIEKHQCPYKISWIKKEAKTLISNVCRVTFSIGKYYQDETLCDMVEMDGCHLRLERPWQSDVDTTYKGRDNLYSFCWQDRKIILMPAEDTATSSQRIEKK